MPAYRNPFRKWLETQPRAVTQTSLASQLNVDRSYISDLMSDASIIFPSLQLAYRIEVLTKGKVTMKAMHDFAQENRAAREAA